MFPNWLQPQIPRKVLDEKYLKISFSQNGEDDYIRGFFWENILQGYQGKYIDIGCYDEKLYSNTKLLSLIGWNGMAIDANPDLKSRWLSERPNDYFLNRCVGSYDGNLLVEMHFKKFYRFNDGAISTACIERANYLIKCGTKLLDTIDVPTLTLNQICDEADRIGLHNPDLISIDLEMTDYLDDLPEFLLRLQPKLLCFELITDGIGIANYWDSRESVALQKANYTPTALFGGNLFAKQLSKKNGFK